MADFKYSRRNHLIGLIAAAVFYIALLVILIISNGGLYYIGWLIGIIIYVVLWWLRGLSSLTKWFPLFHYITLIIEFVSHCLSLISYIYWAIFTVIAVFNGFKIYVILLAVMYVLLVLVYAFLVFVLVAVPYVLLKGTVEQKAELAKEVSSGAAIELPGGMSVPQSA